MDAENHVLPRVAAGEREAVDQCIERYSGLVWSLARRFSSDLADAEDAMQEVFVELWKFAARFDATLSSEANFVALIARRRLVDRLRSRTRRPAQQSLEGVDATQPVSAGLEVFEEANKAVRCLRELEANQRRVLELSIWDGLSHSEIAKREGLPLGTVKTHARRGLIRLRDLMQTAASTGLGGAR